MRKLFVSDGSVGLYSEELRCARARMRDVSAVSISELSVELLERDSIDVVISTGLSPQWHFALRGMGIVTITLGDREKHYESSDIVIDWLNHNTKYYFVGREHSLCFNKEFDLGSISDLIRKLDWDSEFFGFNTAFLSCMHLTPTIFTRIERFLEKERIRLVEYQCNCHDSRSVRTAEAAGFHFVDIRITFTRNLSEPVEFALPPGIKYAKAVIADIPILKDIAGALYQDSRYLFDTNFDPTRVIDFYSGWVEKGVRGEHDDECWCLYDGAVPFAFCTLRLSKQGVAVIGLLGLSGEYRGGGLGKALLAAVFCDLGSRGYHTLTVVTQGRNYAAQNLYQSMGFRTKATQLWYHKWI
jgi:GNAT superfamily N-acetyltransferase